MHSRYQRVLADPAIGGRPTLLRMRVRRFFCDNTACDRRTFVEQVPELTTPYARRTPLLRGILEKIALRGIPPSLAAIASGLPDWRNGEREPRVCPMPISAEGFLICRDSVRVQGARAAPVRQACCCRRCGLPPSGVTR
jgi:hypothetical protein